MSIHLLKVNRNRNFEKENGQMMQILRWKNVLLLKYLGYCLFCNQTQN